MCSLLLPSPPNFTLWEDYLSIYSWFLIYMYSFYRWFILIIAQPLIFCICKSITFTSKIASILSFFLFFFYIFFFFHSFFLLLYRWCALITTWLRICSIKCVVACSQTVLFHFFPGIFFYLDHFHFTTITKKKKIM